MNRNTVLCTLAGLVVGAFAGWVLAPEGYSGPTPDLVPRESLPRPAQAEPVQRPVVDHQPPPVPASVDTETMPDLGALLGELKAEALAGSGAITGTVRITGGLPLGRVQITATPQFAPETLPDNPTLEQEVRAEALRLVREQAGAIVARSDSGGHYRLMGLADDTWYTLRAELDGHEITAVGGREGSVYSAGATVDFLAKAAVPITVDVRMPDGLQAAAAQIGFQNVNDRKSGMPYWYWTPGSPTRAVPPGEWKLFPRGGNYNEGASEPVPITVVAGEAHPVVVIRLTPMPGIVGVIRVPGVADHQTQTDVELLRQIDGQWMDTRPGRNPGRSDRTREVHGVFRGRITFSFLDLEAGQYRLRVSLAGAEALTHDVTVTDKVETLELSLSEPDRDEFVVVRVTGPEGPINERVYFHLHTKVENGSTAGRAEAISKPGGEHWIARTQINRRDGATYILHVRAHELGNRSVEFDPETREVIEIAFESPAFVTIEIVGYEGHPNRTELFARVHPADDPPSEIEQRNHLHSLGRYSEQNRRHGPLKPGEYIAELYRGTREMYVPLLLASSQVTLRPGENTVQITVPGMHTLVVDIPLEYRGRQFRVRHLSDPSYEMRHRAESPEQYEFSGLKPGTYELSERQSGAMHVQVPHDSAQPVKFDPQPFNAVRMVAPAHWPNGEDIGLKPGDIVVMIDSVSVTTLEEYQKALNSANELASTTWVVQRGGTPVTVTFDPKLFAKARLQPEPARVE